MKRGYNLVALCLLSLFYVETYSMIALSKASRQKAFDTCITKVMGGYYGTRSDYWKKCKECLDVGVNPNGLYKACGFYSSLTTPLLYACHSGDEEMVRSLVKCPQVDKNLPKGCTPLLKACMKACEEWGDARRVDIVELLLQEGADPNFMHENVFNETPLIHVLKKERYDLARLLLRYKANPNMAFENNETALFYTNDDICILYDLLKQGADVHCKNTHGMSVLHTGCERGYCLPKGRFETYLLLLINAGININDQDDKGNTPLHYIMYNDGSFVKHVITTLLARGADPMIKNKENKTAYDLAVNTSAQEALKMTVCIH